MDALYAFFRLTDDLADGPDVAPETARAAVADWRDRLRAALAGAYTHPVHAALHDAAVRYGIPAGELEAVIDGAAGDLDPVRVATFTPDLEGYCYRVAGVVGRACVRVWGVRREADLGPALALAVDAGVAFQLTNILRDVGEDFARGRVYLPADDIARFGVSPETWADPASRPAFRDLMAFEAARAREFYRRSGPLADLLTADGRAVFGVMSGVYRRLLDEIERRDFEVFAERVRVGKWAKANLFLRGWPVKWGWA